MKSIRLFTTLVALCALLGSGNGESPPKELMAAAKKDPESAYKLGMRFLEGEYFPERGDADVEAIKNLKVAADKGHPGAQLALGVCYASGIGFLKANMVEAVKYYRKAAEQDNPEAQFKLGWCYMNGLGVPKINPDTAIEWYRKAANQRVALASYLLAEHYYSRVGNSQNPLEKKESIEMLKCYIDAANQGMPAAQKQASMCLRRGYGDQNNFVESLKWAILATASGDEGYLLNIEAVMREVKSSQDISKARKAAADFQAD